jgi:putative acetyltransferase
MIPANHDIPPAGPAPASIRLARAEDRGAMLAIWERAVRATHDFLAEEQILELRPAVIDVLADDTLQWWVWDVGDGVLGFLGLVGNSVEGLFIDPEHSRRGGGRLFIAHAQRLNEGEALVVDVNEANHGARRFYERLGFETTGRSPTDAEGRPHPIIHMRRRARSG